VVLSSSVGTYTNYNYTVSAKAVKTFLTKPFINPDVYDDQNRLEYLKQVCNFSNVYFQVM